MIPAPWTVSPMLTQRPNLWRGLEGFWPFWDGNGRVSDVSGNNNHGTRVNGPVWTLTSRGGYALDFDGTDDQVDLGPADEVPLIGATQATVSLWLNQRDTDPNLRFIWDIHTTDSSDTFIGTDSTPAQLEIRFSESSGDQIALDLGPSIEDTGWRHLVAAWHGGNDLRIYLDAEEITADFRRLEEGNPSSIGVGTPGQHYIGGRDGSRVFNGQIADVRLYSRVLTAAEVRDTYENPWAILTPVGF